MTGGRAGGSGRKGHALRDDAGGVWIKTGVLLGLLVYVGIVTMAVAGFTVVIPLVVIPPVLVALIGANNLIGGGRTYGRSAGRPVEPEVLAPVKPSAGEESSDPR